TTSWRRPWKRQRPRTSTRTGPRATTRRSARRRSVRALPPASPPSRASTSGARTFPRRWRSGSTCSTPRCCATPRSCGARRACAKWKRSSSARGSPWARTATRWTTSSTACCAATSPSRAARARRWRAATRASSTCRSSSTPLRVFDGGKLDRELEAATADYVRRNVQVQSDGAVIVVPRLFRWFAADFGDEKGIVEFVVARIDDEAAVDAVDRRRGRVRVKYADYDWTLNARK